LGTGAPRQKSTTWKRDTGIMGKRWDRLPPRDIELSPRWQSHLSIGTADGGATGRRRDRIAKRGMCRSLEHRSAICVYRNAITFMRSVFH